VNPIFNTYLPDGFSTLNPYLFVENPRELINFLKDAFYAEEISRTMRGEEIANVILKVGHNSLMISQARGEFLGMRTSLYLFVNDVDQMHQRALDHGAREVLKPADMDYDDRQSGIVDPSGNYWWISKRLVKGSY
jgi:uncharacterized glyoxalase superfamily protein PhnB